jgi:hypothetical protein
METDRFQPGSACVFGSVQAGGLNRSFLFSQAAHLIEKVELVRGRRLTRTKIQAIFGHLAKNCQADRNPENLFSGPNSADFAKFSDFGIWSEEFGSSGWDELSKMGRFLLCRH